MNTTRYEPVCGSLPYHDMYANGWGTVCDLERYEQDGSVISIFRGDAWQCENCYTVIVMEGEPGVASIGYYAIALYDYPITYLSNVFVYREDVMYTAAKTLSGYQFSYKPSRALHMQLFAL